MDASMRKAGLPINNVSLLNYVNNSSQSNSLLSALNKKGITLQDKSFEKLKGQAEKLQQATEKMASEETFEEARTSGDLQPVLSNVQEMVKNYNNTIKSMKNSSSPLNQYYCQMLKEAAADDKDNLKGIGITRGEDGTLKLDEDKLKAADLGKLEEILGVKGTFSSKVSFLAERIADNARANASSASNQYNALGNNYFASASRYNFWG